jgi:hypothetical protein
MELAMTGVEPEALVRLTRDIPNLFLGRGAVGTIKSTWCSDAYEVEFQRDDHAGAIRALVFAEQIEIIDRN